MGERPTGPLGIDPVAFSFFLLALLLLFVAYLLLPKAFRVHYFHAYPKRHAWAAVPRKNNPRRLQSSSSLPVTSIKVDSGMKPGVMGSNEAMLSLNQKMQNIRQRSNSSNLELSPIHNDRSKIIPPTSTDVNSTGADDLSVSAVMQQLRDPGLLITAHGSRGKPKIVRLQLVNSAITWRTENRRKAPGMSPGIPPKVGKVHSVPLTNIMYIDAGKQTTALRRVENSGVPENLCFSLLTKEGSLDLEASNALERDALVTSFSLVLDEIHSQMNWREGQRGLQIDMPSSFDEYDEEQN